MNVAAGMQHSAGNDSADAKSAGDAERTTSGHGFECRTLEI